VSALVGERWFRPLRLVGEGNWANLGLVGDDQQVWGFCKTGGPASYQPNITAASDGNQISINNAYGAAVGSETRLATSAGFEALLSLAQPP
jgi:hypothetical protein